MGGEGNESEIAQHLRERLGGGRESVLGPQGALGGLSARAGKVGGGGWNGGGKRLGGRGSSGDKLRW